MNAIGKIGLIIPEIIDRLDYELISGIFRQAKLLGYDVVIYTGSFNSMQEFQQDRYTHGLENIYSLVCRCRLDGVIFAADRFHNDRVRRDIFNYLSLTNVPCLVLGYRYGSFAYMNAPQHDSAYEITKHLIERHNCRKIYCMAGVKDHEPSEERLRGVLDAAADNNINIDENGIFYGQYWVDVPKQTARDIAEGKLEKPDAVVCLSDVMAIAFTDELRKYSINVPNDIAVTGYDGIWQSVLHIPRITTVTGREQVFGEKAVCRLYEMMTGEKCTCAGSEQHIRFGTSCGCRPHEHGVWENDALSPENYITNQMDRVFDKKTFIATDYIDTLSSADSVDELMDKIDKVSHILRGWKWIELCLCEDWQINFDNPDVFRQQGFSDKMYLGLSKRYGGNEENGCYFNTADIIPALNKPHEPSVIVLTSIHCKGQIFGYCAIGYDSVSDIDSGDYHLRWCDAVASGLNALQKKLYIEYVHQQTELLSTSDPATGFLNTRGCIETLPDTLHRLERENRKCALLLISWVSGNDELYDFLPVLAKAMLSAENAAMNIRFSEKCFAMLVSSDSEEGLSHDMSSAIMTLENAASNVSPNALDSLRVITETFYLSFQKPSRLEQTVKRIISDFTQKCAAAESSYVTTKQMLYKLRRDIMHDPQSDWNLTDISDKLNFSITHLQRTYKKIFSVSIKDDVINARIEMAKQLLLHTDLTITEIAEQCGYRNNTHFMRQFKEKTGQTAKGFRGRV